MPRVLQLTAAVLLVASPRCVFDSTPIFSPPAADAGALHEFDAGPILREMPVKEPPPAAPAPTPAGSPAIALDAGMQSLTPDAQANDTAPPPPPPSVAMAGATAPAPPPTRCEVVGSYGLQITLDVSWESTATFGDPGRGPATLYALLRVEQADPQQPALSVSGDLCGLELPPFTSSVSCQQQQFRFADILWSERTRPALKSAGSAMCDAKGCALELEPLTYTLGIRLDPANSPWPEPGSAMVDQFADEDVDSLPGVTAEVVTQVNGNNPFCGSFMSARDAGMPMQMTQGQRLPLALRAQLMAAIGLGANCQVERATGAVPSLELRSAGCTYPNFPQAAMSGNTSCADEVRGAIDQNLPQFRVLGPGEAPTTAAAVRDTASSRGTQVSAIRFAAAGAPITCRDVRAATF